jgi:phosphoribosylanthranilate isomerase
MITKITLTGADNSIDPKQLVNISKEHPLVEWGILVSNNNFGSPRFPSKGWLTWLAQGYKGLPEMNLSCHLCGRWVRELCFEGKTEFISHIPIEIFKRIQLNFHAIVHKINKKEFLEALKSFKGVQFIFQLDDVNNDILKVAQDAGINAVPLFDTSGGAGVLPESWPASVGYAGYAGGLSPDNLAQQMPEILKASDNKPIWIDAETRLRSEDDKVFEEDKCLEFIKQAYKYI